MQHKNSPLNFVLIALVFVSIPVSSASAKKSGSPFRRTLRNIGIAAKNAAFAPQTWGSAAASAIVYASGKDRSISDWASTRNPVFGSPQKARDASDFLCGAARISSYGSLGLRFSMERLTGQEILPSLLGATANGIAVTATSSLTNSLKTNIGRERPDALDTRSFPSGHTSISTVFSTLYVKNSMQMNPPKWAEIAVKSTATIFAAGTGWARVEGKRHYLSDVLAGAAVGHFFGAFIHDAFLGPENPNTLEFTFEPVGRAFGIQTSIVY